MIDAHQHLYSERRDASRNMARFYALSIEPTLFGDVCLTRRWGRIGTRGQMKAMSFAHEEEALAQFTKIQRQKASRGYRECLPEAVDFSRRLAAYPKISGAKGGTRLKLFKAHEDTSSCAETSTAVSNSPKRSSGIASIVPAVRVSERFKSFS